VKLYHVITGLSVGGAEMMLYKLLAGMDRDRVDNTVVSLTDHGPVGDLIHSLGVPVRTLGMKRGKPNPLAVFQLARWIRRDRPHAVQTWMYHADLIGGFAARLAGRPPVAWGIYHGTLDPSGTRVTTRWTAWAGAKLSRWLPERIVFVSHASKDYHSRLGYDADKMIVIPIGFKLAEFSSGQETRAAMRHEIGIPEGSPTIGLVARWHAAKDHGNFFAAARLLARDYSGVHFVLCGSEITWANQDLVRHIDANGVRPMTHLLGPVDNIPRLMSALDIATSSSIVEGFPNVVGEAMASGVPCVVTDVGDCALIVGDSGRVVAPRDPEALAAAWAELLELPDGERLALGAKARERVKDNFSIGSVVAAYESLYREMTGVHAAGPDG
jgi:glycosyltransferase involved in cell wall biosynthesis